MEFTLCMFRLTKSFQKRKFLLFIPAIFLISFRLLNDSALPDPKVHANKLEDGKQLNFPGTAIRTSGAKYTTSISKAEVINFGAIDKNEEKDTINGKDEGDFGPQNELIDLDTIHSKKERVTIGYDMPFGKNEGDKQDKHESHFGNNYENKSNSIENKTEEVRPLKNQAGDKQSQVDNKHDLALKRNHGNPEKYLRTSPQPKHDNIYVNTTKIFKTSNSKLNEHNFTYMINNETICSDVQNLTYLIYVHTSPQNADVRQVLRETWAKNSVIPAYQSRIIFMIGKPYNEKIQSEVYKESKLHGDIIQEDYNDSYKNLTLKAISALKWITTYCNKAKFVFKTDDDIFLDLFYLMKLLRNNYWSHKRFFLGMFYAEGRMPILRDPRNCLRWCVKESEFKGKWFPRYLSGGFLVISGDLIQELYRASKNTPFFWVDDVYLSGLLPKKLSDVSYYNIGQLYAYHPDSIFEKGNFDPESNKKYLLTISGRKATFWQRTILMLPEEDKNVLGRENYSKLLKEAEHSVIVKRGGKRK